MNRLPATIMAVDIHGSVALVEAERWLAPNLAYEPELGTRD